MSLAKADLMKLLCAHHSSPHSLQLLRAFSLSPALAWPLLHHSKCMHRSAPTRPWRSPCLLTQWAQS